MSAKKLFASTRSKLVYGVIKRNTEKSQYAFIIHRKTRQNGRPAAVDTRSLLATVYTRCSMLIERNKMSQQEISLNYFTVSIQVLRELIVFCYTWHTVKASPFGGPGPCKTKRPMTTGFFGCREPTPL